MNSLTISRKQFTEMDSLLDDDPRIDAAFLLGSAVRGRMRRDSDIDLALLPAPSTVLTGVDRVHLAVELEKILGRQVDIGILGSNNLVYAKEAYLTGTLIFCRDSFRCGLFGASVLGMYAELREARREVEHAYQTG